MTCPWTGGRDNETDASNHRSLGGCQPSLALAWDPVSAMNTPVDTPHRRLGPARNCRARLPGHPIPRGPHRSTSPVPSFLSQAPDITCHPFQHPLGHPSPHGYGARVEAGARSPKRTRRSSRPAGKGSCQVCGLSREHSPLQRWLVGLHHEPTAGVYGETLRHVNKTRRSTSRRSPAVGR
jgi:hypothetical protein